MASSKYWKDREKKWQTDCQKQNTNWQKEINDVYQTMSDEISDQIAVFYQKYADENGLTLAQAKQYLDQTDIRYYSSLAKRYCEDAAKDMDAGTWEHSPAKSYFTTQANQEMKRYNTTMKIARLDMLKHQIDLRIANAQRKVCSVIGDALNDRAMQTYTRQAGILGKTVLNNLSHVKTIVQASFHGATFSDRIWGTQQAQLKKVLSKALQDCLILGKGAAPFTRELAKVTGKTKRQAQRLISTELARVQVQAAMDSMKASGFDEFQIIASPDCCDECQAIDGKHFPIAKLAAGTNAPPMHPNCRCSIAPFVARDDDDDDFDEESFDEWCDYMEEHEDDPNAMTWEEWKKKSDEEDEATYENRTDQLIKSYPVLPRHTEAEIEPYYRAIHFKTVDQKTKDFVKTEMRFMSIEDLKMIQKRGLTITQSESKNSYYRRNPLSDTIAISPQLRKGSFMHEFAHFYYRSDHFDSELLALQQKVIDSSTLTFSSYNGKKSWGIKCSKFISQYQGRLYGFSDRFSPPKAIVPKMLKEYVTVGYETYVLNPQKLLLTDPDLYNYFNKAGGLHREKKRRFGK
ncbi:MAG: minor capsid protein [Allobaculum sp.]|uniref:minor capsid protein n=1 Tax=Allobaculum sp. TaxID=1872463 RepID=UPI00399AE916